MSLFISVFLSFVHPFLISAFLELCLAVFLYLCMSVCLSFLYVCSYLVMFVISSCIYGYTCCYVCSSLQMLLFLNFSVSLVTSLFMLGMS